MTPIQAFFAGVAVGCVIAIVGTIVGAVVVLKWVTPKIPPSST